MKTIRTDWSSSYKIVTVEMKNKRKNRKNIILYEFVRAPLVDPIENTAGLIIFLCGAYPLKFRHVHPR